VLEALAMLSARMLAVRWQPEQREEQKVVLMQRERSQPLLSRSGGDHEMVVMHLPRFVH
jgi:hypothetical protein